MTIEPKNGADVYASEDGDVCIKQQLVGESEVVIALHPDDIPALIEALGEMRQEALHRRYDPPGIRNA